jgi:di/tricarboxylate transporter
MISSDALDRIRAAATAWDFVRVGLPLDLLCGVVAIAIIPYFFPF